MTATRLTRTQFLKNEKQENLTGTGLMAVAALTGRKADRELARDHALGEVTKLLTGQAAGGNRKGAVLALRACMGLEGAVYDSMFEHFKGSLSDVAALGMLADPVAAARVQIDSREAAAREIGVLGEVQGRFEKERKALTKARDAAGYPKLCQKVQAFLADVAPLIQRAQEKLAEKARQAETA